MLPRGVLAPIRGGCGRAVVRLLATSLVVFQLLFVLWLQPTAPAPAETLLVDEMDTKARMEARAERGEAMGGVRGWKLQGTQDFVYVLQLEGGGDFTEARRRWGLRGHPQGSSKGVYHPGETKKLCSDCYVWVVELPEQRQDSMTRKVRRWVEGEDDINDRLLAITAVGVPWVADNREHRRHSPPPRARLRRGCSGTARPPPLR